ncbi:hypothetical protein CTI12_AA590900 [Artemisia annua]|uniref:Uncharacterized protein n=1 Tax=Artemisia annua TaxID=35608 RepID=A0A2U1KEA2_ARTAN|nr:hypothetical protein CTI12_AA590900 [Artemisia annua]
MMVDEGCYWSMVGKEVCGGTLQYSTSSGEGQVSLCISHGEKEGVDSRVVLKDLKEAQCFVKLMVVVNVVYLPVAPKVLKVLLHYVKATEEESDAYMKEAGFAQKVCMVGLIIVWLMVVERDTWYIETLF